MLVEQLNARNKTNVINADSRSLILPSPVKLTAPVNERRHAEFFEVIGTSLKINTPEDFGKWAKTDLQHIFPHGMLICGIGLIQNQGAQIHHLLTCNLPPQYIQTLHQNGGMGSSPVFAQWVKTRRPVLFELAAQRTQSNWLENLKLHGLINMAAHGQCDLNSQTTSYFSFSKICGSLTMRHAKLLEMLVPHLHVALIRAFNGANKEIQNTNPKQPGMTEREHEILKWLSAGKTNREIAQVLKLSEHTIKSHVHRIFTKLKVCTRAQAVAKLLSLA